MKTKILNASILVAAAALFASCAAMSGNGEKVVSLPPELRTPDGMALGGDGNLYLSINQLTSGFKYPSAIARFAKGDNIETFFVFEQNSKIGKVSPMGIVFADGDIYVADNQMFLGKRGKSRILRIEVKDGKPVECTSVVENLQISNGIAYRDGRIYLTDCAVDDESYPMKSAVYSFSLAELKSGKPVVVSGLNDPHLSATVLTRHDGKVKFGADGIAFDKRGRMYVANLGEAQLLRFDVDKNGKAGDAEVLFKGRGLKSTDGLQFGEDGKLYIADFLGNAVARYCPETQTIEIIKTSPIPNSPENGGLDTPAEAFPLGGKLYISNMNMAIGGHKTDGFEAVTIIDIK